MRRRIFSQEVLAVISKKDVYVPPTRQCYMYDSSSKYDLLATSPGVVVQIRKEHDGIIYASHQAPLGLRLYQRAMDHEFKRQIVTYAAQAGEDVRRKSTFVSNACKKARRLPASTKWCIG